MDTYYRNDEYFHTLAICSELAMPYVQSLTWNPQRYGREKSQVTPGAWTSIHKARRKVTDGVGWKGYHRIGSSDEARRDNANVRMELFLVF